MIKISTKYFASTAVAILMNAGVAAASSPLYPLPVIANEVEGQEGEELLLADHVKYDFPASKDCNATTTSLLYGIPTGMAIIGLGTDINTLTVAKNAPKISMYRGNSLLKQIDPNDEGQVSILGVQLTADDDLLEFEANTTIYMVFSNPGDSDFNQFLVDGAYKLVIPDGVFENNNTLLKGTEVEFNYSSEATAIDMSYVLDPVDQTVFSTKESFVKSGVLVTFPKASILDYDGKGGGSFVTPSGKEIACGYAQSEGNGFRYTMPAKTELTENGAYIFKIAPNFVAIDLPNFYDGGSEQANFPGLEAIYFLEDSTVGVALVGIGAADSYDVYTLDGKVILSGAKVSALQALKAGVYIINGKKVLVKK